MKNYLRHSSRFKGLGPAAACCKLGTASLQRGTPSATARVVRVAHVARPNSSRRDGDAVRYLLSPQDLMALESKLGIAEEYVALTTAAYRQAIDRAWDSPTEWEETPAAQLLAEPETARPQHQRLVRGIAPKHRGVFVGTVCAVQSATASFALKLAPGAINVPLRPGVGFGMGAGIFFDQSVGLGEDSEVLGAGGKVSKLRKPGGGGAVESSAELQRGDMLLDFGGRQDRNRRMKDVKVGDLVWRSLAAAGSQRNKDEALEEQVKQLSLANNFEQLEVPEPRATSSELRPGHPATLARLKWARELHGLRAPVGFLGSSGPARVPATCPSGPAARGRVPATGSEAQRGTADGHAMLVRSCGALHQLLGSETRGDAELIGDFSLNAANAVTAAFFLGRLDRLTPSHDLSAQQICQLAKRLGPQRAAKLEVVAHQHLAIFHTEHCVFCRFLSNGNDYTVGFFRLELVDEVPEAVETLVRRYHAAAQGRLPAEKLWSYVANLRDSNGRCQGVERGSLDDAMWREREFTEMKVGSTAEHRGGQGGHRDPFPTRVDRVGGVLLPSMLRFGYLVPHPKI
eukprot:Skav221113  [mRNA]  locus=scaffold233:142034:154072:- [translate_table: standard]